jgi:hypothetical protein
MHDDFTGLTFAIRQKMKRMMMMMKLVSNRPCWKIWRVNLGHQTQMVTGDVAHSTAFMLEAGKNLWLQYEKRIMGLLSFSAYISCLVITEYFYNLFWINLILGLVLPLGCCACFCINDVICCHNLDWCGQESYQFCSGCSGMYYLVDYHVKRSLSIHSLSIPIVADSIYLFSSIWLSYIYGNYLNSHVTSN